MHRYSIKNLLAGPKPSQLLFNLPKWLWVRFTDRVMSVAQNLFEQANNSQKWNWNRFLSYFLSFFVQTFNLLLSSSSPYYWSIAGCNPLSRTSKAGKFGFSVKVQYLNQKSLLVSKFNRDALFWGRLFMAKGLGGLFQNRTVPLLVCTYELAWLSASIWDSCPRACRAGFLCTLSLQFSRLLWTGAWGIFRFYY